MGESRDAESSFLGAVEEDDDPLGVRERETRGTPRRRCVQKRQFRDDDRSDGEDPFGVGESLSFVPNLRLPTAATTTTQPSLELLQDRFM